MRPIVLVLFAWLLTNCGTFYQSPDVKSGPQVAIIPMTAQSVAAANQSGYQPRALPAAFRQTAGTGGNMQGAGALPDLPPAPSPQRPLRANLPPKPDPGPYKIGVGDILQLATPSPDGAIEQLSGLMSPESNQQGFVVQDDGAINIPNVGRIDMAGQNLQEAEAVLFQRLVENQLDPTFSLEIATFNARKVAVGGAVTTPAVVPITLTPLYLSEALAHAGGLRLTDQDTGALRLYRDGTLYQIPVAQYLGSPDLQRLRLLDGDSIHVDAGTDLTRAQAYFEQQISRAEVQQQARELALRNLTTQVALRRDELTEARESFVARDAMGAVRRDHVYLFGEVGVQARYPLPFEQRVTLADALFEAGNGVPIETGDVSQIYVLRRAGSTPVTAWQLDGRDVTNFTLATMFELRPNDLIFVAEQPITRWGRVISQISPSLITTGVTEANK
ncbi:polysaccharide biosynthesis/export family protein [Yoonia sediminilitoris]|uniref:Polysaccharide export outer membrane protein n=1 Tax=Yoonia sediminilitoris TaxID=1286148 RepID=A0A2T6KMI6_9RHOB|nr:polysaccharide biosynthesis/export family protein [Yoonia sediminilitoris]PUB17435.1 polysaccharide export outer membrane protein [Yoonia sediminilitoris]RCW97730.1 polysaccharide export outer membrane protein [Yoonia sediminilitoris]